MIRTSCLQQSKVTDAKWEKETRWIYYDRENFQIYRKAGETEPIELIDEGRHGLAALRRVPVFEMKVSRRAVADEQGGAAATGALQQVERAVVGADDGAVRDAGGLFGPRVEPDCGRVLLHPARAQDDRFGWTEPEGKVYQIAADNLERLKDEIYRVCYLMSQAGSRGGDRGNRG